MKIRKEYLLTEATIDTDNPYAGLSKKPEDVRDTSFDVTNINQAILNDDANIVKNILKQGIKPNEESFKYALIRKDPEIVDIILKRIPKNDKMLIQGIKTKNPEVVKSILNNGIKPNQNDRTLDYSILTNNNEIVNDIIQSGGKISPLSLFLGINTSNLDIVKTLVEKGKIVPTQDNIIQARNKKQPNQQIINYLSKNVLENNNESI